MNLNYLEFERPIAELEAKIEELRRVGNDSEINIYEEITKLEGKSRDLTRSIFLHCLPRKLYKWRGIRYGLIFRVCESHFYRF